jgi:DNA polymerase-3 subunit alpha
MGIKVLPPDVNESDSNFTPRGTDIRFGLSAIRNVGENVVGSIVTTRRAKGRYADFPDFLAKVEPVVCNKKVVESLIKAGAFDSLGHARRGLLSVHADVIDAAMGTKRAEAVGQFDLFGSMDDESVAGGLGFDVEIPSGEWDKTTLLAAERDMLGLYVSDHPLFGVEHVLARAVDCPVTSLTTDERPEGTVVTIGGIVSSLQRKMTKQGSPWAIATVEDLEGAIEVLFFPQTYAQYAMQLAEDAVVCVKGRLNRRDDVPTLAAIEMFTPDLGEAVDRGPVVLQIPAARCTPPVVERLREVLATHPGVTEVQLQLRNGARTTVLRLDEGLRVAPTPALMGDLKALLGPSCLVG